MASQQMFQRLNAFLNMSHSLREGLNRRAKELIGLTLEQVLLLCRIDLLGGRATISSLASANHRASHTVSGMVQDLARLGLASKSRPLSDDRRQVQVFLTPQGRAKVELYRASIEHLLGPVFSSNGSPELAAELDRLILALEELLKDAGGET